ncbi:transglutaminase family protein [Ruminococcus sp.]|uniref:transglutaminase domain-containing protein n=1 Tax=Ruminococcus sp. TaxID=41978 RepID=UPI001B28145F|nr:transglutaminase family protein [Ruminococcus sp.]MBO5557904.1 transglutaminase family protein [Ruminococcus sp.]
MKNRRDFPAALIFAFAAGLLVYMLSGVTAGASVLLLCTITAAASNKFGRLWGLAPAVCAAAAAVVFRREFMAECALCADEFAYRTAVRAQTLYAPVTGAADSAWLVLLAFCGAACALYAAFGARVFCLTAALFAAAAELFTDVPAWALCTLIGLTVGTFCFGENGGKALLLTALTALLTAPASLLAFPETPPKGEVTASGGLPLYLAEEYERADLTKNEYARASAIFLALEEQGFDPHMQSGLLIEAAGEELPLDDVTAPEGYQPANICAADSGRTQVCRQFGENVFLLISKLKSGRYLDCEGLYREYVYSAYGKLTADEQREMEEKFGIDGTLPLDRKLAAVKSGINAKVTDESERSPLTVKLARSCGLAAREVRGVYFGAMPASGRADLSEGEQRSWVEVYIDGAGWAVFESKPEYAGASPLLPEGASPDGESTFSDSAEQYIYAAAPPRTAAEIRTPDKAKKPSPTWAALPAGTVILLVFAGRARAFVRWRKRSSKDFGKAVTASHFQGRELLSAALCISEKLPPEEAASQLDGLLRTRFERSERAFERMRFSNRAADEESAKCAAEFHKEVQTAAKKCGLRKRFALWLKGLV